MPKGRASNGSGSITKKSETCYELRWSVDGKRKSKCFRTFTEADKARREITAAVDAGIYIEPQKMRLAEWLEIWLQEYCGHISHGTLILYRGYVNNHIVPALGHLPISKITPHIVQHFINTVKYKGKKAGQTLSYKTRKNIHGCLSAAFEKAVEIKYIRENPATGCSIPRNTDQETSSEINPFAREELEAFLVAIKGSVYEEIYTLALNTGMRLSEILGLRWSRFDKDKARIKIDCQLAMVRSKGEKRVLAPTKNKKTRSFKVAPSVVTLLGQVKKKQSEKRLSVGKSWQYEIDDLVFTDDLGRTIPHASVEHEFACLCDTAGIVGHRFHDLRHTFATLALQNHADVKTLSQALGHYSVAFTLDVYGHVSDEMADNFAALMESVISAR